MKKLFLTLICMFSAIGQVFADDVTEYLSVLETSGAPGSTITVTLNLTNPETSFCAFQCDIVLPNGLTVVDGTLKASDRCSSHTLASNVLNDGTFRILCYSMSNELIAGESGAVATFDVKIDSSVATSTYQITTKNSEMVDSSCIAKKDTDGQKSDVDVKNKSKKGDINGDDKVNTTDLTLLINYILGKTTSIDNADLNEDTKINTSDLTELINIILGK